MPVRQRLSSFDAVDRDSGGAQAGLSPNKFDNAWSEMNSDERFDKVEDDSDTEGDKDYEDDVYGNDDIVDLSSGTQSGYKWYTPDGEKRPAGSRSNSDDGRYNPETFTLSSKEAHKWNYPVKAQLRYQGHVAIPSSLANKRFADVEEIHNLLNELLDTDRRCSRDLLELLQALAGSDFGRIYALVRPWWEDPDALCLSFFDDLSEHDAHWRECEGGNSPRRVWDLWSNRVVPLWAAATEWDPDLGVYRVPDLFAISHSWVEPDQLTYVKTPINQKKWGVPIPGDANLDDIRIELLNMGAQYAWLDALCIRQDGGPEDEPWWEQGPEGIVANLAAKKEAMKKEFASTDLVSKLGGLLLREGALVLTGSSLNDREKQVKDEKRKLADRKADLQDEEAALQREWYEWQEDADEFAYEERTGRYSRNKRRTLEQERDRLQQWEGSLSRRWRAYDRAQDILQEEKEVLRRDRQSLTNADMRLDSKRNIMRERFKKIASVRAGSFEAQEEVRSDLPAIGTVYGSWAHVIAIYLNGLGLPFAETDLSSPRHWCNRAWTMQEWATGKPVPLRIAGVTARSPPFWIEDTNRMVARGGPSSFAQILRARMAQSFRVLTMDITLCVIEMRRRSCSKAGDRIHALSYILAPMMKGCPGQLPEQPATRVDKPYRQATWTAFLAHLSPPNLNRLLFFYPEPGDRESRWDWAPSWPQLKEAARMMRENSEGLSLNPETFSEKCHAKGFKVTGMLLPTCYVSGFRRADDSDLPRRGTVTFTLPVKPFSKIKLNASAHHRCCFDNDRYALLSDERDLMKCRFWVIGKIGEGRNTPTFTKVSVLETEAFGEFEAATVMRAFCYLDDDEPSLYGVTTVSLT